jgi:hypothetical protein
MTTVIMRGQITGGYFTDNGDGTSTHREYPAPGQPFDTDAATAARLISQGMALEPEAGVESAAVDTSPKSRRV